MVWQVQCWPKQEISPKRHEAVVEISEPTRGTSTLFSDMSMVVYSPPCFSVHSLDICFALMVLINTPQ